MARSTSRKKVKAPAQVDLLNRYGRNVTSQHGEDGILAYLIGKMPGIPKACCEFGAWDGKFLSNVYTLWHDQKWRALLIESDHRRCEDLCRDYGGKFSIDVVEEFVVPTGKGSLDEIFRRVKFPTELGILSIDIDSNDYDVWKHVKTLSPWIVVIEHNHMIPPWVDYHDPEGVVFLRASAKAMERLGKEKGYRLVCCTLTNGFFVREDKFDPASMPDLPVERLFDYKGIMITPMQGLYTYQAMPVFFGQSPRLKKVLRWFFAGERLLRGKLPRRVPAAVRRQIEKAGMSL